MARITIPGARELTIVVDRDDLRDETLTEISLGEAEAYAGLLRVLGDGAAMGAVRAVLSDVSPGVALRSLRDHEVLHELARHVADGACRVFERVSVGYRRGEGEAVGREPLAHPPQAPPGRLRPGAFAPFLGGGVAMGGVAPAAAPAAPAAPPPPAAQAAPAPEPRRAPDRKVLTVRWEAAEAWCSEEVRVTGTTREYGDGEAVLVEVRERASRRRVGSVQASVAGNAFAKGWAPNDVLPARADGKLVERMDLDGTAGGAETPKPLAMRFVPAAPRTPYASGFTHFALTVADHVATIEAELKFVPGWGGEVVDLGGAAAATGGAIAGFRYGDTYRWMRDVRGTKKYWDGAAWRALPVRLTEDNNFCVGFHARGASFVSQYGGTWPEAFPAWWKKDSATPAGRAEQKVHEDKLHAWEQNIETTWGRKFDLKRVGCRSAAPACCRYELAVTARFLEQAAFADGMLIVAPRDIRSNSQLWFLEDGQLEMASHEFGHHLGNPDEYAGASGLDASLEGDGAVHGIDEDSIMGTNMTKVKKRHLRTVCAHLATMVRSKAGKSYTYEPVQR